jgi:GMP reductase
MILESGDRLDFDDVLIKPKRSTLESRKDVNLVRLIKTRHGKKLEGVPVIASNMATGSFKMLHTLAEHKMFTAIAKHHSEEWFNKEKRAEKMKYGFYTIGIREPAEFEKLKLFNDLLVKEEINIPLKIIVDVANGYIQKFSDFIHIIRKTLPDSIIFAGNVCTPEMAEELIISGADGVKIGVGPGAFCKTRVTTGVGYPQLDAIISCADAAHGLNGLVIADGGCKTPGDVAKAFCANADMVMLGTMFAGTDECDGSVITKYIHDGEYRPLETDNGKSAPKYEPVIKEKKFKVFYGMSSDLAQASHFGGIKDYRASEGLVEEVPYKGSVNNQVRNILGGLRSCGTYIGASSVKNFGKCASFIKVNRVHSGPSFGNNAQNTAPDL